VVDDLQYDVFVSYRWIEPDQSWVREQLVPALERADLRVCLDVRDFRPGVDAILEMDRALGQSRRAICVLSPEYFDARRHTNFEALWLRHRDPAAAEGRLIPLVLRPTALPGWIMGPVTVDWTRTRDEELAHEWRRLLRALEAKSLDVKAPGVPHPYTGIASREVVFESKDRIPGQVFAIELLTQPILLTRDRRGRTTVAIDRDGVTQGLYTTEAKRDLCRRVFDTPQKIEQAHLRDAEIHRFLLGESKSDSLILRLEDMPLRWASGGVMSIVHWRNHLWTPFFFRDIPPCGWNIALGASEKGDDLSDPWTFLLREFLEETLVLDAPPRLGVPIDFKRFYFQKFNFEQELARAEAFASEHIQMRRRSDGLMIRYVRDPERFEELDPRFCVVPDFLNTTTEISIELKGRVKRYNNLLVCINLLELGIEVVKIVEYALEDDDYFLDGELLDLGTHKELLRMPVALVSHRYLKEVFDGGELQFLPGTQPSIEAPPIPADDIHIFEFDAQRRLEIVSGTEPNSTPWEKRWHGDWREHFGDRFFDESGNVTNRNASTWFTPSSAKVMSYFFANVRRRYHY
jgi:hypothetical protein